MIQIKKYVFSLQGRSGRLDQYLVIGMNMPSYASASVRSLT